MRLSAVFLLGAFTAWAAPENSGPADRPIRVLLTYGGHGFAQAPFFAMFEAMPGIQVTKAPLPQAADRLKPGLERDFDVIVRYDMVAKFTPEQRQGFVDLLNTGIGLVALHHNLGAHRDWPEYRRIIGGKFLFKPQTVDGTDYAKSPWADGQEIAVHIEDSQHPVTKGLRDFVIHDETYGRFYVADGVKLLLSTTHPKCNPQLGWTLPYGKSRVVYLMLGHDPKAWRNPAYPVLVRQAIVWSAER